MQSIKKWTYKKRSYSLNNNRNKIFNTKKKA